MMKRICCFLFIITNTFNLYSQPYFSEVSDFQKFNHTYFNVISGAGVSFVDFNQDGFDDISIPTNDDNSILFFKNSNNKFDIVNFNIDFPIVSKTDVKGENAHEIYKWALKNHGKSTIPKWNFHKILINSDGKVEDTYLSFTKPMSKKIIDKIEQLLDQ